MTDNTNIQNLQKRMNKKIAQLTKVVYVLNSKTEDMSDELKDISEAYELEIKNILSDSATKISEFKNIFENMNLEMKLQETITKLTDHHEKEKDKFVKDFEAYKTYVDGEERKFRKQSSEKFQVLQTSYENLVKKFEARTVQFEDALKTQLKQRESDLSSLNIALEEKYQRELETHVLESNQKYNKMLKENLAKQVELEDLLESEKQRLIDVKDKEIYELTKKYESTISLLKSEQENANDNKTQTILDLTEDLNLKAEQIEKFINEISAKDNQLKKMTDDLRLNNAKTNDILLEIEKLTNQLNESNSLKIQRESELQDLRTKLETLDNELSKSKLNEVNLIKELKNTKNGASDSIDAQKSLITKLEVECMELTSKNSQLVSEIEVERSSWMKRQLQWNTTKEELINELSKYEILSDDLKKQIETLNLKLVHSDEEFNNLKIVNSSVNSQFMEAKDLILQLQNEIITVKSQYDNKLELLKNEHDKTLHDLEIENAKELSRLMGDGDLIQKRSVDLEDQNKLLLNKNHDLNEQLDKLKQIVDDLKSEIFNLQEKNNSFETELSTRAAMSSDEVQSLKAAVVGKSTEINEAKLEIDRLTLVVDEYQAKYEDLESELDRQKQNNKLVQTEKREFETKMTEIQRALSNDILELKNKIKQLEHNGINVEENIQKERNASKDRENLLKHQLATQETNYKASIQQYEDMIKEMQAQVLNSETNGFNNLEALRTKQNDELEKMRTSFEKKEQQLLEDFEHKMKDLEKEHKALISDLSEEQKKILKETADKYQQELKTQKYAFEKQINLLKADHLDDIRKIGKENEQSMELLKSSLQEEFTEAKRSLKLQYETDYNKILDELNRKSTQLINFEKNGDELELQLKALKERLIEQEQSFKLQLDEQTRLHEQELLLKNKEFKLKEIELNKLHEIELNELNNQFVEASNQMEERCRQFEEITEEWKTKYLQRSSKPEDLQTISELKKLLEATEKELVQTREDMKYFQLELINRDESYTKIFGRQPNAGIVDPVAVLNTKNTQRRLITNTNPSTSSNKNTMGSLGALSIGNNANLPPLKNSTSRKGSITNISSRMSHSNSSGSIRKRRSSSSR
eukprot:TRINITY_DN2850_c0_g2_i1.p1 TRINITY_DN2850_c0_g2~~TRINITY_DN2850_c0_g2_i1.p1  ORF type:complete len:1099 (-),score=379.81 TRINITY_DN2850_c0_g2_i1:860-4156(-)